MKQTLGKTNARHFSVRGRDFSSILSFASLMDISSSRVYSVRNRLEEKLGYGDHFVLACEVVLGVTEVEGVNVRSISFDIDGIKFDNNLDFMDKLDISTPDFITMRSKGLSLKAIYYAVTGTSPNIYLDGTTNSVLDTPVIIKSTDSYNKHGGDSIFYYRPTGNLIIDGAPLTELELDEIKELLRDMRQGHDENKVDLPMAKLYTEKVLISV